MKPPFLDGVELESSQYRKDMANQKFASVRIGPSPRAGQRQGRREEVDGA
jgi:hypothetical protein